MASLNNDDEPIEVDECVADGLIELNCHDDDIEDVDCDVILDVDCVNDGVWIDDVDDVEVHLVDCLVDVVIAYDVNGIDALSVDVMFIIDVDYVDDIDVTDVCVDALDDDQ